MKYKEDPVFREVLGGFLRIDKLSSNTVKTFSGDRRYRGQKEKIDEVVSVCNMLSAKYG